MVRISPSILSSDFSNLAREVKMVEEGGADFIHVDVMDGVFVPNITVGIPVVRALKRVTNLPLDVHLMIVNPERYIQDFANSGAKILTVHQESTPHLNRALQHIKELGCLAGVAINPSTPLYFLEDVFPIVDLVLVMLVNPGFPNQRMIESTLSKVKKLREIKGREKFNFMIEVDGGVKLNNFHTVVQAGAEVIVSGSGIFEEKDPKETIRKMKSYSGE